MAAGAEDIFKKFAVKMGIQWDEAAGDILEDKITELCGRLAPELAGLSTALTGNLDEFNTAFSGLSDNALKAMQEVANNSSLMDQIGDSLGLTDLVSMPKLRELVGTGSKEMVNEVFKAFQGYPELLDEITTGSKTLEDGLGELYGFLPKLGKGVRELDTEWSKSDTERYNIVERNLSKQLTAYENMREGLIKEGLIINAPSLVGLDDLDKARVLQQEMENLKGSVQGVAKAFEASYIKDKSALGLTGQIAGTITQFQTMQKMSKAGLLDPAFSKNMGITGHLFRGLTVAMGETGGGMAKIKAFSGTVGSGFIQMGTQMLAGLTAGTLGIAAVIAALVAIIALFAKIAVSAIDYRETLKEVDQLYGGMGDKLTEYSNGLRETNLALLELGLSWEDISKTTQGFMKAGLDWNRATGKEIVGTSLMMSKAFGMSEDAASAFIGKLMVANKISERGVVIMGNQIAHAKQLTKDLKMAPIEMGKLQEAIEGSSEAFSLAKSKGEGFTRSLTNDMVGLTAMTTALGLSAGAMAKKMEEASNLITSTDSKFRNLLIISGGTSVQQLMTGEVNRSQAMMATVEKLQQFGRQFGGNLHLASQMAEKVFGVSKDEALKLMNMTQKEKENQQKLMDGIAKLTGGKLKESYNSVTGTIMESWTKFKNVLMGVWMQIVSNEKLTKAFTAIGEKLTKMMEFFGPDKPASKMIGVFAEKIGNLVAKLPEFLDKIMAKFEPWMKALIEWMENFGKDESSLGDKVGDWVGKMIQKLVLKMLWEGIIFPFYTLPKWIAEALVFIVKEVISFIPTLLKWISSTLLTNAKLAFDSVSSGIKSVLKEVKAIFSTLTSWDGLKNFGNKIVEISIEFFKNIWEAVKGTLKFWKWGSDNKKADGTKVEDIAKTQQESIDARSKEIDTKNSRMDGMKDTDVIYDNGVWKYAGEKRDELDKQKIALAEEQKRLLETIAKNTGGDKQTQPPPQKSSAPSQANKGNGSGVAEANR